MWSLKRPGRPGAKATVMGLCTFLLFTSARNAPAVGDLDIDLSATLASRLRGSDKLTQTALGTRVHFERLSSSYGLYAGGELKWDPVYNLNDRYSEDARDEYLLTHKINELYIAGDLGGFELSAGYQYVVWGVADELRVVDVVNPLDVKEFVLLDLSDMRQSLPMVRLNGYFFDDFELELLYVPFHEPTKFAEKGSEFHFDPLEGFPLEEVDERTPAKTLRNNEFGARLSKTLGASDLGIYSYYGRTDDPVYRLGSDAMGLVREYPRFFMAGLSSSSALGVGLILRTELSLVPNSIYMSFIDPDLLVEDETLTGLAGLDYMYKDWLFSLQATDRRIKDWTADYAVEKHSPIYTASVEGTSFSAKLKTRLSYSIMGEKGQETLAQAKFEYSQSERFSVAANLDLLNGAHDGAVGAFGDRDRILFELTYRL